MSKYHSKIVVKKKLLNYTQEMKDEVERAMKLTKHGEMKVLQDKIMLKGIFDIRIERHIDAQAKARGISREEVVAELAFQGYEALKKGLKP